jgi:lysophospholipase L1-like esterase
LTICSVPLIGGNEKNYTYLALGDSVAFGLDVTLLSPDSPPSPDAFTGYPEAIAAIEHLQQSKKEVNAACPGETSSSFVTGGTRDYGCNDLGPQGQPPFKTSIGLHTYYPGTQLSFAVSELSANKHISLVTLGIGANDGLLLLRDCASDPSPSECVASRFPGLLEAYRENLVRILTGIRTDAKYAGTLILVKPELCTRLTSPCG